MALSFAAQAGGHASAAAIVAEVFERWFDETIDPEDSTRIAHQVFQVRP